MVRIKLAYYDVNEKFMCTEKQYGFLRGLMNHTKHEDMWLNHLAFNGREKLSISEASKLIDCCLNQKDFVIIKQTKDDAVVIG